MIKEIAHSFATLLFPPLCIHCSSALPKGEKIFCKSCLKILELIDPTERCPFCFTADFQQAPFFCPECSKRDPIFDRLAAAFDYWGPAATLVRRMKYCNQPYLSNGCGAYLAAQWVQLKWPKPDFIIPTPLSFMHFINRGYNQSLLLCQALSEILQTPTANILKRKSGDYSQAALDWHQRIQSEKWQITIKKNKPNLTNKTLLLIDDVMTTGTTLRKCGEILLEEAPAQLYALTLCRAIR